ncbi:hypothetical protein HYH03_011565 [Edaphochlamys debaryana]|uniref:CSC1/OSCA1-like cytosolic domain-containing protein n=1 Tax=Edaphochlamys debaryana TaxID=47281 RepID=A0A835XRP0_9CHLO|nr:hypothetical protein HYH03_011565 [Edaphochlamys debaryana]|eukprot:KAG2489932.1 hypothetical protein HYH03_011565 [Edaphochlamys debaryana]
MGRFWESVKAVLVVRYRDPDAVLREYGSWKPPDEAEARQKFLHTHTHHDVFDVMAPIKQLKEFGEGVQLYFAMLKLLALLFCGLALVPGLVNVVFCGLGRWYDQPDLTRTMLGNYGLLTLDGPGSQLNASASAASGGSLAGTATATAASEGAVTALFRSSAGQPSASVGGMDKGRLLVAMSVLDLLGEGRLLVAMSVLDLLGVLVFFGFCLYLIYYVRRVTTSADRTLTTIKDYSVRVERVPPDTHPAALKDYLQAAGGEGAEVVQVELCRKVDELLSLVIERGEAVEELDLHTAVLQRTAEVFPRVNLDREIDVLVSQFRLLELQDRIRAEQQEASTAQVVSAFVTFATPESRSAALAALPRSRLRQWRLPAEDKFANAGVGSAGAKPVALDVSEAPEPSDIQYENLEYGKWQRFVRLIFTNLAKYLVMLAGFALVSLAPAMRMGLSASQTAPLAEQCNLYCSYTDAAGNYQLQGTNRTLYRGCDPVSGNGTLANRLDCEDTTICFECYCRAALNAGRYGELPYCFRFANVVALSVVAQALAVLGIVVANFIIQYAVSWLATQEKHHTRSREAVAQARTLFITQFVNTAFSNLVANMYLPGPAAAVSDTVLDRYIFNGGFGDTTPNWYGDVGRPIVIAIFLTTLIIHLKIGFLWWWRRHKLATRYKALTQRQLDEAYEGHEFELSIRYGQHLYVIFVVVTYSSGMPILYILAAVHFASCYWAEKFELLKVCKRPLSYSRDLALYVSTTLPFAALWHVVFAMWFYSLFGMARSGLITQAFATTLADTLESFSGLMARGSQLTPSVASAGHHLVALMALGCFLFVYFTISAWVALIRSVAASLGVARLAGKGAEEEVSIVPEFGVAVRSQMLVGPSTYSIHENPAYAHAFVRMEDFDWEIKALEAKAAAVMPDLGPTNALVRAFSRHAYRKLTTANRLRVRRAARAAQARGAAPSPSGRHFTDADPPPPPVNIFAWFNGGQGQAHGLGLGPGQAQAGPGGGGQPLAPGPFKHNHVVPEPEAKGFDLGKELGRGKEGQEHAPRGRASGAPSRLSTEEGEPGVAAAGATAPAREAARRRSTADGAPEAGVDSEAGSRPASGLRAGSRGLVPPRAGHRRSETGGPPPAPAEGLVGPEPEARLPGQPSLGPEALALGPSHHAPAPPLPPAGHVVPAVGRGARASAEIGGPESPGGGVPGGGRPPKGAVPYPKDELVMSFR